MSRVFYQIFIDFEGLYWIEQSNQNQRNNINNIQLFVHLLSDIWFSWQGRSDTGQSVSRILLFLNAKIDWNSRGYMIFDIWHLN